MIYFFTALCLTVVSSICHAQLQDNPDPICCKRKTNVTSDRYLKRKIPRQNHRYKTFIEALDLMKQRGARIIVETGTSRNGDANCCDDGCATIIFAEWARDNNAIVYSVDIDGQALVNAGNALGRNHPYVYLIQSDSVVFLRNFRQSIDMLYLDSYDFEFDNPEPSQLHHLNEVMAAEPWLTADSIVMIDDCDLPHGGKGKLAIEYLLTRGWKIASQGYQVILLQDK